MENDAHAEKGRSDHGDEHAQDHTHEHGHEPTTRLGKWMHFMQANAIPLLLGIVIALIWCNVDPASYERIVGAGHGALRIFGEVRAHTTMMQQRPRLRPLFMSRSRPCGLRGAALRRRRLAAPRPRLALPPSRALTPCALAVVVVVVVVVAARPGRTPISLATTSPSTT